MDYVYLKLLKKTQKTKPDENNFLNRHGIMHGNKEYLAYGTRPNALRSINLLLFLINLEVYFFNIYIQKNNQLIGWIDVEDEIRPDAKLVIETLHKQGVHTILLSGDRQSKCDKIGKALGIQEIIGEQSPADKLTQLDNFMKKYPTAMVGDGINDAPALAKATIGISLSNASHIAIQTAQVILMNQGLKNLPMALGLGKRTYETIKENLIWAFSYNIIAIPVAALGLLGTWGPTYGALIMGLSDVVLAINSLRLFKKKLV